MPAFPLSNAPRLGLHEQNRRHTRLKYRISTPILTIPRLDCVSFKPNSTNILVQSLWCNGSHGISVGSLGQYPGAYDIVENIFVSNISMHNASDGARIKVWPNSPSALSGDLQGGGGSGRVRNVTYGTFYLPLLFSSS